MTDILYFLSIAWKNVVTDNDCWNIILSELLDPKYNLSLLAIKHLLQGVLKFELSKNKHTNKQTNQPTIEERLLFCPLLKYNYSGAVKKLMFAVILFECFYYGLHCKYRKYKAMVLDSVHLLFNGTHWE